MYGTEASVLFLLSMSPLGMSMNQIASAVGASRRTGQRWSSKEAVPSARQVQQLAGMVYPHDATLAARLAAAGGTTLEALGLVEAVSAAAPAARLVPAAPRVVDAVVCAAAEALNLPPGAVRPAVLAAFSAARELGLTMEAVEAALLPPSREQGAGAGKPARQAKRSG